MTKIADLIEALADEIPVPQLNWKFIWSLSFITAVWSVVAIIAYHILAFIITALTVLL